MSKAIKDIEAQTGKLFGDSHKPLLVSVRSGAAVSMPGMMDTVLNLGLNRETLGGLIRSSGSERFAYDSYRRFIQLFGKVVLDMPGELFETALDAYKQKKGVNSDGEMDAGHWQEVVEGFLALVKEQTNEAFPEDPHEQLRLATIAVLDSWNGRRAVEYRNFYKIPHDLGTAVNVVAMVFGNMGPRSGTGVAFTRDPSTGDKLLFGEYLTNAKGKMWSPEVALPKR